MGNINQGQGRNGIFFLSPQMEIPKEKPIIVEQTSKAEEKPDKNLSTKSVSPHCAECNKKLGITNQLQCRCGNIYCMKHLHSFNHKCTFDYKKFHKEKLIKENPVIKPKLRQLESI